MNAQEFERMVHGSVFDDGYLDSSEDENLMQAATAGGMDAGVANAIIEKVLAATQSAREKALLERLRQLLDEKTRDDKFLDAGEERDCLQLCEPTPGKRKGLDDAKCIEFMDRYCQARGIKRASAQKSGSSGGGKAGLALLALAAVLVLGVGVLGVGWLAMRGEHGAAVPAKTPGLQTASAGTDRPVPTAPMAPDRRAAFDRMLGDAEDALTKRAFTTPADGSVLFFVTTYYSELRESDRETVDFAQIDERRLSVCRQAVAYYCEKASHDTSEGSKWRERGRVMAGACREPELLACFGEAGGASSP